MMKINDHVLFSNPLPIHIQTTSEVGLTKCTFNLNLLNAYSMWTQLMQIDLHSMHIILIMWTGLNIHSILAKYFSIINLFATHHIIALDGILVYVIVWVAVLFGINCASNAGRKLVIY